MKDFWKACYWAKQNLVLSKWDILCRIQGFRSPYCEKVRDTPQAETRWESPGEEDQNIVLIETAVHFLKMTFKSANTYLLLFFYVYFGGQGTPAFRDYLMMFPHADTHRNICLRPWIVIICTRVSISARELSKSGATFLLYIVVPGLRLVLRKRLLTNWMTLLIW